MPPALPDLSAILEEIHAELAPRFGEGKLADYIPQLARRRSAAASASRW